MLVQKRQKTRKAFILWSLVALLVALSGFFVYQNISSTPSTPSSTNTAPISKLPIPENFGEEIFSDSRFNNIATSDNYQDRLDVTYTDQLGVRVLADTTLEAPEGVRVDNPGYGGSLAVSWDAVEQPISGYALYRATSPTTGFEQIAFLDPETTEYLDTSVTNGQLYYYRVTAALRTVAETSGPIRTGESENGFSVDPISDGGMLLSWDSVPESITAFTIERMQNGSTVNIAAYVRSESPERFSGNTAYADSLGTTESRYIITWLSVFSESAFSLNAQGTAEDTLPPNPPDDVTVENGGDGNSVVISWTNPLDPDFDYVKIYKSDVQGRLGSIIKGERTDFIQTNNGCERKTEASQTVVSDDMSAEGDCYINTTDITEGETYYFTLTSVDTNGNESPKRIIGRIGRENPFLSL